MNIALYYVQLYQSSTYQNRIKKMKCKVVRIQNHQKLYIFSLIYKSFIMVAIFITTRITYLRPMIKNVLFSLKNHFAKKRMMDINSIPKHQPTTNLWKIGEGKLQKTEIVVGGWNVNGVRSILRKNQLNPFINKLEADFFCLNQTKIDFVNYQKQTQSLIFPHDYFAYWNFCKISSGYSGVLTLTKHKPLKIVEDLPNYPKHSLEGRIITLEYQTFYLVNIYQPNAGKQLQRLDYIIQEYDLAFLDYIKTLKKIKSVIIVGDINLAHDQIDLAKPKQNKNKAGFTKQQRESFRNILKAGFVDTYRHLHPNRQQFTYWSNFKQCRSRNIGWRIDYILATQDLVVKQAAIHDEVKGSDHCPFSARIKLNSLS